MAIWDGLRARLEAVDDRVTLSWSELEALVGGLPPSAFNHRAFWGGDRRQWAGFRTTNVRVGEQVTFYRVERPEARRAQPSEPPAAPHRPDSAEDQTADAILLGCVKSKRAEASAAKDLYTSALFREARAHAEAAGVPWFILSAEHGLVHPDKMLAPYDRYLAGESRSYREAWGERVTSQLASALGSLGGRFLEIHAGSSYVDALRLPLDRAGARLRDPLHRLTLGQRLAWYGNRTSAQAAAEPDRPSEVHVDATIEQLTDPGRGFWPADFVARHDPAWRTPGLYSWWVDAIGAAELSAGLGHPVSPGLIYAGQAGATRAVSARSSSNTLWGRIRGMHLGGRHEFSTFRRTLGAVLAAVNGDTTIDEQKLTDWMHAHLRVIPVPTDDGDTLDALETEVLSQLDPPLNLAKMPRTPLRARLTELRRPHSR